ncbi:t107 [Tupaiid betaherpesvirus 1]|uniref:T107 n=1 Tax=Tupaiid herpesvirus 1 (strain 1) TaxID=10397 RepID=Q91TJ6_TUHV1|nr:t107 [Tupaiid betaherpesvirus 1]AAK57151.1 t107 [Tupaiid betaherpesvirus 1]
MHLALHTGLYESIYLLRVYGSTTDDLRVARIAIYGSPYGLISSIEQSISRTDVLRRSYVPTYLTNRLHTDLSYTYLPN